VITRAKSPRALLDAVGNTPLVDLSFLAPAGVTLSAKLESVNPNGSLKDRPVARMTTRALEDGRLDGGRRLLDSSSGNAGIAYAAFGAALGVPVTLVVPGNASRERIERMRAHGAEVILTDPLEGYDFAIEKARELAASHPERYWYCNQYENPDNARAHYEGTGREIVEAFATHGGAPDAFVCGIGTGGSLTGIGHRLREANPQVHVVAVIPERFPGVEGLKPLGAPGDLVPRVLDAALIDERAGVTIEEALAACALLARAGIFAGPSSGAYVHTALALARSGRYRRIVTLLCDTGERYVSTGMWER
jgi:cysteine synthase B